MVRTLQQSLLATLGDILQTHYHLTLPQIALEQPPSTALGELALPLAFELAKRLRKAPRVLATELAAHLSAAIAEGRLPGIASVEVAGAGYLNLRFDRASTLLRIAQDEHADIGGPGFRLIEHTSINPNKAAHIGHLRNAILGDTFARLLRRDDFKSGWEVGVQNYIDNTGVQVADIVVGLVHLEGHTLNSTHELLTELLETNQRIDFVCWDLYARVSAWYTATTDPAELARRKQLRLDTLHALERGNNDTAAIADLISTAVLRRHLETMQRLSIEYDFLPRESEILTLDFWTAARQLLLDRGVLYLETAGKNRGCYVMRRAGNEAQPPTQTPVIPTGGKANQTPVIPTGGKATQTAVIPTEGEAAVEGPASPTDTAESIPDEDAKVIVRSNGTVTYVGKDIAYHLWKFGLLPGKDFGYQPFYEYAAHPVAPDTPDTLTLPKTVWISTPNLPASHPDHPVFGKADAIVNVIDSRQNDPQNNVIAALRGMGFTDAADRYTHFSYEMVALTPRCAVELGYQVSDEDQKKAYIEVSGRKGFGVKADDLLDRLIAAAQTEVDARHPELNDHERLSIATQIAVGALRYFMLRFTRNTVIAFDFKDALSFEGETGPYLQYAVVRAANILRKSNTTPAAALEAVTRLPHDALAPLLSDDDGTSIWETWLLAARLTSVLEQSLATAEPAHLARYAFQLAQQFNTFYHRHHVLNETDPNRRTLLLATAAAAARELTRTLAYLGIETPPVM